MTGVNAVGRPEPGHCAARVPLKPRKACEYSHVPGALKALKVALRVRHVGAIVLTGVEGFACAPRFTKIRSDPANAHWESLMEILYRSDLELHRLGDAREYRLVDDGRVAARDADTVGAKAPGQLVSLADVRCAGAGETASNDCAGQALVLYVADGGLEHTGTADERTLLRAGEVLVYRAGVQGASHRQRNPEARPNRVVRLTLAVEASGPGPTSERPALLGGRVNRIYPGSGARPAAEGATCVEIASLEGGQSLDVETAFLAYVVSGAGFANEDRVEEGTLLRGDTLSFDATESCRLLIVHTQG